MIQQKIIDLSKFKNEGVTLYLKFKNIGNAFHIIIKDADGPETYYKRTYEKPDLTVNLPVHADRVIVIYSGADLDTWLIGKIKIHKLDYKFNDKILIKRPYPISAISIRPARNLPHGSEARFLYNEGIIEYDIDRCSPSRMAQPVLNYILDHEIHHYWYGRPIPSPEELQNMPQNLRNYYYNLSLEDESECDRGALYAGINKGYNFSGIIHGLMDTLNSSHYNVNRIVAMHNEIKNMHQKLNL